MPCRAARLLCVFLLVAACHKKKDKKPEVEPPRDPLVAYDCPLEETPASDAAVTTVEFIPGTNRALLVGMVDASEIRTPYALDLASGTLSVLANSQPVNGYSQSLSLYENRAVTADPSTVVVRMVSDDMRRAQVYALKTDGTSGALLGDPALAINEGWLSPDRQRLIVDYRDPASGAGSLAVIDLAGGTSTSVALATGVSLDAFTFRNSQPRLTPDGSRIVYTVHDSALSTGRAIMSTQLAGASTVRLSLPSAGAHNLQFGGPSGSCLFNMASNGRVVYAADVASPNLIALYAVNADGTNPVTLSQTPVAGDLGVVPGGCPLTSDGRIVYTYSGAGSITELDVVGLDGSGRTRLDATGLSNIYQSGDTMRLTPAGDAVIFADIANNLVLAKLDGSGRTTLAANLADSGVTVSSDRVLFLRDNAGAPRLWSVRYDGGDLRELTPAGTTADSAIERTGGGQWTVTSDGQVLVRRTRGSIGTLVSELFALRTDGSGEHALTPGGLPTGRRINNVLLDPSSASLVMVAAPAVGLANYLYTGTLTTTLEQARRCAFDAYDLVRGPTTPEGNLTVASEQRTSNGDTRALVTMRYEGGTFERARFAPAAGTNVFVDGSGNGSVNDAGTWFGATQFVSQVSGPVYTGELATGQLHVVPLPTDMTDSQRPVLAPDGSRVAFLVSGPGTQGLWVAASDGSNVTRITPDGFTIPGTNLAAYRFTPDSQRIVFLARDTASCPAPNLYVATLDGMTVTKVNGSAVDCGYVSSQGFSTGLFDVRFIEDGASVLYVAAGVTTAVRSLYSARLDGSTPPLKLTADNGAGSDVLVSTTTPSTTLTPDGTKVIYAVYNGGFELWTVPLAGGTSVKVATQHTGDGAFRVSSSSDRLAFVTQGPAFSFGVSVGSLAGGAPTVVTALAQAIRQTPRIFGSFGNNFYFVDDAGIHEAAFDSGTSRLLFPIDFYLPSVRFNLSQDGSEVFFIYDIDQPNIPELYALSVADGTTTRLSPKLGRGSGVTDFFLGPNGSIVALADHEHFGVQDFVQIR